MFEVGQRVIDTKKKIAPEVSMVFPGAYPALYILRASEEYYIADEDDLIEYDKYWFDDNQEKKGV